MIGNRLNHSHEVVVQTGISRNNHTNISLTIENHLHVQTGISQNRPRLFKKLRRVELEKNCTKAQNHRMPRQSSPVHVDENSQNDLEVQAGM